MEGSPDSQTLLYTGHSVNNDTTEANRQKNMAITKEIIQGDGGFYFCSPC